MNSTLVQRKSPKKLRKAKNIKTVTAIQAQKKNNKRCSVFLDNEFAFGVHQDVLLKSGISKGDQLSEEQIEAIAALEDLHRAKQKAYKLLAVRARSEKELRDRLVRDQIPGKIIDTVITDLKNLGMLNDREFALMFARSRMITRPEGAFLLRRELFEKGIDEAFIDTAVDQVFTEKSESDWAFEVAAKRKRQIGHPDDIKTQKKVSDFLQRRGFRWEIVREIMDRWNELDT